MILCLTLKDPWDFFWWWKITSSLLSSNLPVSFVICNCCFLCSVISAQPSTIIKHKRVFFTVLTMSSLPKQEHLKHSSSQTWFQYHLVRKSNLKQNKLYDLAYPHIWKSNADHDAQQRDHRPLLCSCIQSQESGSTGSKHLHSFTTYDIQSYNRCSLVNLPWQPYLRTLSFGSRISAAHFPQGLCLTPR